MKQQQAIIVKEKNRARRKIGASTGGRQTDWSTRGDLWGLEKQVSKCGEVSPGPVRQAVGRTGGPWAGKNGTGVGGQEEPKNETGAQRGGQERSMASRR